MNSDKRNIKLKKDEHLKQNQFNVEPEYFNTLTEKIMNGAKASESELEFNLHLKQNKLQVPNMYFDSLSQRIEDKLKNHEIGNQTFESSDLTRSRRIKNFRWLGVAASLFILASIYLGSPFIKSNDELAEVSYEYLIEFLNENANLDEDLIANITDIDLILDEIYAQETGDLDLLLNEHPELDYDFEYYE